MAGLGFIRIFALLLVAAVLFQPFPLHAASYLARCPAQGDAGWAGESGGETLMVTAQRPKQPGCTVTPLPIEAGDVLAAVPAPHRLPDAPEAETITVSGSRTATGFEVREIAIAPAMLNAPPPYLLPDTDLRAAAAPQVLGARGRAQLSADGAVSVLECEPGDDVAGMAFASVRLPPIPGITIRIVHSAEHNFHFVAFMTASGGAQEMHALAKLRAAENATEGHVDLGGKVPVDTPLEFAVICPAAGGRLALSEATLEAKTSLPPERHASVRIADLWQHSAQRVFARAQSWGLTRVSILVPMSEAGVADPQALAGFVTAASNRGIAVWALLIANDGDDKALLHAGAALADYNAGVSAAAQVKGVTVEAEQTRYRTYVADPGFAARAFLDRLVHLRPALGMPLEAVVPAWFPTDAATADRLGQLLDGLTVAADRTEPLEIRRMVARFLAWGSRRGKPVYVALQTGPLPDGERDRYVRAQSGELWLISMGGEDVLLLAKEPATGLPGRAFGLAESIAVPAAQRSFADRRSELREVLLPLARRLSPWPAFGGFAFDGLFLTDN